MGKVPIGIKLGEWKINQKLINALGIQCQVDKATPEELALLELKLRRLYLTSQWQEFAKMADEIATRLVYIEEQSDDDLFKTSDDFKIVFEDSEGKTQQSAFANIKGE